MIRLSAGLRDPWVEWDGATGIGATAGKVWLDGQPVPVAATTCNVVRHHDGDDCHAPRDELCRTQAHPDLLCAFSWFAPLENGAWVYASVDDHISDLVLYPALDDHRPMLWEVDGALTYTADCLGAACESCLHDLPAVMLGFESRDEYFDHLRRLGSMPVRLPEQGE